MIEARYEKLQQVLNRRQPDLTVIMENVHKPHNLSAIMRTCDAVGIGEIHGVHKEGDFPTFRQVAQGSQKWVTVQSHSSSASAISLLQKKGFKVYAAHLSDSAFDFRQIDYTQPTAILLGTERWGVTPQAAKKVDRHIIIPMQGMVQSLNVSVAAAVILFEAQRQRLAAGLYERVRISPQTYNKLLFEWAYPEVAEIYRRQGQPYPPLAADGQIQR
ncbi:MAG: tRNA (guanosine(18)-2'-O)-methyltransferase TrmH [Cyanobacteria bacterium J083]|nr:MAG: tRNA (guanosine(18)-2'-O)-methyltransferase TrmH [Cyanobacteria bacterium J083]